MVIKFVKRYGMNKQIIVTLDKDGALATLLQTRVFTLYHKSKAQWHNASSFELAGGMTDATLIRETVDALAKRYPDCRIIVSKRVSGVAFQMLNKTGFSIFETDEISDELFNNALDDVMKSQVIPESPPMEPKAPNGDGHFVFDLVRLQKAYPQVSSKKALMAFIAAADFITLELICDHLPPWMEEMMEARGYRYSRRSKTTGIMSYFIEKT